MAPVVWTGIRSSKKDANGKYLRYTPDTTVGDGKYITQSDEWIKHLVLSTIADDDCVLFMWFCETSCHLHYEVMKAWVCKYVNIAFIWNKKEGSGKEVCYYSEGTMRGSEIVLLGKKQKYIPGIASHKVWRKIEAIRDKRFHLRKPVAIQQKIVERMAIFPEWNYSPPKN